MNIALLRLGFVVFWLLVAAILFFRQHLLPPETADRFASRNTDIGALLAAALAVWNLVRWYLGRRAPEAPQPPARRGPLQPRPHRVESSEEYIPEFDFSKPDAERGRSTPQ